MAIYLLYFWLFWSKDDPNSFLDLINPQFDINNIFLAQKPSKICAHETPNSSWTIYWRKKVFFNFCCAKQNYFDELQRHDSALWPSISARNTFLIPVALNISILMNDSAIISEERYYFIYLLGHSATCEVKGLQIQNY